MSDRTDSTVDEDTWEAVARETLWQALHATRDDLDATIESVASTVYFGHELDSEQVERMRRVVGNLEYVTEAYLAQLCDETDPGADGTGRAPSWQPLPEGGEDRSVDS